MNKFNYNYNYRYTFYDKNFNELYEFIERKKDLEEVDKNMIKHLIEIVKNNKNVDRIIFKIERYDSLILFLDYIAIDNDNIKNFILYFNYFNNFMVDYISNLYKN